MYGWYAVLKALHLIGMVSWMAGLFYLVRIMVNHAEAWMLEEPARDILTRQYHLMEQRVYKVIVVVAVVLTWVSGTLLLVLQPAWLQQPWMLVKLLLLAGLTWYTWYCKTIIPRLAAGPWKQHTYYRALNEVPTLFLVAIVFLAVFRMMINWWYLGIGMSIFSGLIGYAIWKVRSLRG
jgi:protoporphyrinogen IX oxidase